MGRLKFPAWAESALFAGLDCAGFVVISAQSAECARGSPRTSRPTLPRCNRAVLQYRTAFLIRSLDVASRRRALAVLRSAASLQEPDSPVAGECGPRRNHPT